MKKTAKLVAFLLAVAMVFAMFSGCGKKEESIKTDAPKTDAPKTDTPKTDAPKDPIPAVVDDDSEVTICIGADSGSLYPLANSQDMNSPMRLLYDVPFDTLADGTHIPRLVESFETVSDTEYILHLRQGVTFANGNPFTAEDFMFSVNLLFNDPQFFLNVKTFDPERSKIIDEYTVDYCLSVYDPTVWTSMDQLYMFDSESYDIDDLAVTPNGTGPYELVEYVPNSHISFKARSDWWGGEIAIKNVNVEIMGEDAQKVNAMIAGQAQYSAIPLKDVEFMEAQGFKVVTTNSGGVYVGYMNASPDPSNPLNSPDARRAVYHAINVQSIIDVVSNGQSVPAVWPASAATTDFDPKYADLSSDYKTGYNLDLAKELAAKSGLEGKTLRVITNGADAYVTMAEIIQNNLKDIGVTVEIHNYDQATYFSLLMDQSNYEIGLFMLVGSTCFAMDLMPVYAGMFYGGTWEKLPEFSAFGARGISTTDPAEFDECMTEMVRILDTEFPWASISELTGSVAYTENLGGIEIYLDGLWHAAEWYYTE